MSLALIAESAKEVRRLAIAGSALAVGDFRLKKLVPQLEQAGAKAPVFAQVAKSMAELVDRKESDSAANLLNLSTLLNAILYTQGQSSVEGELGELESLATQCSSTRTTARALKPLVQALTSSGAGRFEIIKAACERGALRDLRVIEPAIQALGDSYPELADLVADKVLPAFGSGIVPRLSATLDLKGKKHDARKLMVMHRLDPTGTLERCKAALEDGSPDVKTAAIACLGKHEDCLPLLLEQANSKNKAVRAAALEALAEHDRPEITRLFTELVKGKALDLLARAFGLVRNREVVSSVLGEGKRVFALLLKGDHEQIPRYWEILDCLNQRCLGSREAEVEGFLLECFNQCDKLSRIKRAKNSPHTGPDVITRLSALLCLIATPAAFEAILAERKLVPPEAFGEVLKSALTCWPPGRVYEEFSPLLESSKGPLQDRARILENAIWSTTTAKPVDLEDFDGAGSPAAHSSRRIEWDPRWLDAAVKADQPNLVCWLARPDHPGAMKYLVALLEAKPRSPGGSAARALGLSGQIIATLARCRYSEVTDAFLKAVGARLKGAQHVDYDLRSLFDSARHLPVADLPRLDAFAAKLDDKFVDQYLEGLALLRAAKSHDSGPTK